jgi:hypothetical protein
MNTHRANSAVLIGAFQVIYMDRTPKQAYAPLEVYGVREREISL